MILPANAESCSKNDIFGKPFKNRFKSISLFEKKCKIFAIGQKIFRKLPPFSSFIFMPDGHISQETVRVKKVVSSVCGAFYNKSIKKYPPFTVDFVCFHFSLPEIKFSNCSGTKFSKASNIRWPGALKQSFFYCEKKTVNTRSEGFLWHPAENY